MSATFMFSEDKIRKGSEPFKTGVHTLMIEDCYIAEKNKRDGGKFISFGVNLVDPETNKKLFLSAMNAEYCGSVEEDGTWNFLNSKGEAFKGLETINQYLYVLFKQAYSANDLQTKVAFVDSKVKEFGKDIDVKTLKELIGKTIAVAIRVEEDGYVKDGTWVDTVRYKLDSVFNPDSMKTAFEISQNKPASFAKEFEQEFDEDYVSPLWDKEKIALRDKHKAFEGADTSTPAQESDSTSASSPEVNNDALAML